MHRGKRSRERVHEILRADAPAPLARLFRGVHHATAAAGIGVILADTVPSWQHTHNALLDDAFHLISLFFLAEFTARVIVAPLAASHRPAWRARLAFVASPTGIFDLLGALPGALILFVDTPDAMLSGIVWVFKFIRFTPGLAGLHRVVSRAREPLASLLLGFGVVLLSSASLEYLFERSVQPNRFSSIPAALWWAIETLTTTGYGDSVPDTLAGRVLAGAVMIGGIMVLALTAGILATGFAEEMRRFAFLRTWSIVAKVPFFQGIGAEIIAEVAWLLRPRDYPAGTVVVRRGERGDCMYFIAAGEVEIHVSPRPLRLAAGDFFGEIALLTGAPRTATVVAAEPCTLLRLDIVEFRELIGRRPDLARVILDAATQRLGAPAPPISEPDEGIGSDITA